jgi:hypothetical protein
MHGRIIIKTGDLVPCLQKRKLFDAQALREPKPNSRP